MAVFRRRQTTTDGNRATKAHQMSWMAIYGYALAIAFVPAILYLGSMHGYIDVLYEYTFGVPNKANRATYSVLLAFLGVNIVVASFLGKVFDDPLDVVASAGGKKPEGKKDK